MIFPTLPVLCDIDLKWFPEVNISHKNHKGFYTVGEYINRQPMARSNVAGIAEWIHSDAKSKGLSSPLMVADSLGILLQQALNDLKKLPKYSHIAHDEVQQTQSDIEAFASIGLYYAEKIRATYNLVEYDKSEKEKFKESCFLYLKKAQIHGDDYANFYTQKTNQPYKIE
jgi:hypothetical protein